MAIKIKKPQVAPAPVVLTITVTLAQLTSHIAANTLVPGVMYIVTPIDLGTWSYDITGYFIADTINTINPVGTAFFYNADYDNIGTYTSPGLTGINLGVWINILAPAAGDVAIWNNKHYENTTGANGATDPSLDAVNWQVLTEDIANGYIYKLQNITYDVVLDKITSRYDLEYNNRYNNDQELIYFKWGSAICVNNTIDNFAFCKNCNTTANFNNNNISGNGSVFVHSGQLFNSCKVINTTINITNDYAAANQYVNVIFENSYINAPDANILNDCLITNCSLIAPTNFTVANNAVLNQCSSLNAFNNLAISNSVLNAVDLDFLDSVNITNTNITNSSFNTLVLVTFVECILNQAVFNNVVGSSNSFTNCIFTNYDITGYSFANGNLEKCSFTNDRIIIRGIIAFTGAAGSGAVGALNVPPAPITNDFFPASFNYAIYALLVGAGASIAAGTSASSTAFLDAVTGDIATLSLTNYNIVPSNDKTPAALNSFSMEVLNFAITAGSFGYTAVFEPIHR